MCMHAVVYRSPGVVAKGTLGREKGGLECGTVMAAGLDLQLGLDVGKLGFVAPDELGDVFSWDGLSSCEEARCHPNPVR